MKKGALFMIGSLLLMSLQAQAADLKGLGATDATIAALGSNPGCVTIAGKKFDYVKHAGVHVASGHGRKMRLMAYQDAPPFEALAVIIDSGKVSREVVQVDVCSSAQMQAKSQSREQANEVVVVAESTSPPPVIEPQSVKKKFSDAPVSEISQQEAVQPIIVSNSGDDKKGFYMRGALRSIDTLNVSYAKYSPFNGEDKERHGSNLNIKARWRPFQWGDLRFGGYATYTDGESDTYTASKDRWSYTDYETYGLGLSGLYDHGSFRSSEMDLGLLWQDTEGWTPARDFRSWQEEKQWEARYKFASSNRRENGELWIPYWETGLHYIHPFDVSYHDTKGGDDAYDNRRIRLWGMSDIYDWHLGDSNQWRLTPTFNAEIGYLWGKDSGYIQGGPGSKLAYRGQEIFEIKFLNPRLLFEENGSRIYDYIGTWKVDNTFRALWAEEVQDYRPGKKNVVVVNP